MDATAAMNQTNQIVTGLIWRVVAVPDDGSALDKVIGYTGRQP